MFAVIHTEPGGPEVLSLVDRPVPEPGPGEVRVRIHVSGVNPTDWKARRSSRDDAVAAGPVVPHQDGAGVVDDVGRGVTDLAVGDRVWVWEAAWQRAEGTAQEYVVLPRRQVVPLPDGAGYDVGASLGIPALTAHRCLTGHDGAPARLEPGALNDTVVLVAGGAGAVGHAAIQLARWAGARVATTVSSPRKAELARRAGAQLVVDYRTEDVAAAVRAFAPDGVHLVVEVAPGANHDLDAAVLASGGTVAVYANDGRRPFAPVVRDHMTLGTRYQFVLVYTLSARAKDEAVAAVSAALADGALPVGEEAGLPLRRFPLAETGAAQSAVEAGFVGKVLVDVG